MDNIRWEEIRYMTWKFFFLSSHFLFEISISALEFIFLEPKLIILGIVVCLFALLMVDDLCTLAYDVLNFILISLRYCSYSSDQF